MTKEESDKLFELIARNGYHWDKDNRKLVRFIESEEDIDNCKIEEDE